MNSETKVFPLEKKAKRIMKNKKTSTKESRIPKLNSERAYLIDSNNSKNEDPMIKAITVLKMLRDNKQTLKEKLLDQYHKTLELFKKKKKEFCLKKITDPSLSSQIYILISENILRITKSFLKQNQFYFPHSPFTESTNYYGKEFGRFPDLLLFHPSNGAIIFKSHERIVLVDIIEKRDLRWYIGNTEQVTSIDVSEDGRYLLVGYNDKILKAFDIVSGIEIKLFPMHTTAVVKVKFSYDGKILFTISGEEKAFLLRIFSFEYETEIFRLEFQAIKLEKVYFTQADEFLVCIPDNKFIKIFDLKSGKIAQNFNIERDILLKPYCDEHIYYDPKLNSIFQITITNESNESSLSILCYSHITKIKEILHSDSCWNILKTCFNLSSRKLLILGTLAGFKSGISYWSRRYLFFTVDLDSKVIKLVDYNMEDLDCHLFNQESTVILFLKNGGINKISDFNRINEQEIKYSEIHSRATIFAVNSLSRIMAVAPKHGEPISIYDILKGSSLIKFNIESKIIAITFSYQGKSLIIVRKDGLIEERIIFKEFEEKGFLINLNQEVHYCTASPHGKYLIVSDIKDQKENVTDIEKEYISILERRVKLFSLKTEYTQGYELPNSIMTNSGEIFSKDEDLFAFKSLEKLTINILNCETKEVVIKKFDSEPLTWIFSDKNEYLFCFLENKSLKLVSLLNDHFAILKTFSSNIIIKCWFSIYDFNENEEKIMIITGKMKDKREEEEYSLNIYSYKDNILLESENTYNLTIFPKAIILLNPYFLIITEKDVPTLLDQSIFKPEIKKITLKNLKAFDFEISKNGYFLNYGANNICLFDVETGSLIWEKQFKLKIIKALFTIDGALISVFFKGFLYYLDVVSGDLLFSRLLKLEIKNVWSGLKNFALAVKESENYKEKVLIFDISLRFLKQEIVSKRDEISISKVLFLKNSDSVSVLFSNRKLKVYSLESGSIKFEVAFNKDIIRESHLSPNGKDLFLLYNDGGIETYDLDNRKSLKSFIPVLRGDLSQIKIGATNNYLICLTDYSNCLVYDTEDYNIILSARSLDDYGIVKIMTFPHNLKEYEWDGLSFVKKQETENKAKENIYGSSVIMSPNEDYLLNIKLDGLDMYETAKFNKLWSMCIQHEIKLVHNMVLKENIISFFDQCLNFYEYDITKPYDTTAFKPKLFEDLLIDSLLFSSKDFSLGCSFEKRELSGNNYLYRIEIYNLHEAKKIFIFESKSVITSGTFILKNTQVALVVGGHIEIYSISPLKSKSQNKLGEKVCEVESSSDGLLLVSGNESGKLIIYESDSLKEKMMFMVENESRIIKITFNKNNKLLCAATESLWIYIYETLSSKIIYSYQIKNERTIYYSNKISVYFNFIDENRLFISSEIELKLFNCNSKEEKLLINNKEGMAFYELKGLVFDQDNKKFALISNKDFRLFDFNSFELESKFMINKFYSYQWEKQTFEFTSDSNSIYFFSPNYMCFIDSKTGKISDITWEQKKENLFYTSGSLCFGGIIFKTNKSTLDYHKTTDDNRIIKNLERSMEMMVNDNKKILKSKDGTTIATSTYLFFINKSESINLKESHKIEAISCFSKSGDCVLGISTFEGPNQLIIYDIDKKIIRNKISLIFGGDTLDFKKALFKDENEILIRTSYINNLTFLYNIQKNKFIDYLFFSENEIPLLIYSKGKSHMMITKNRNRYSRISKIYNVISNIELNKFRINRKQNQIFSSFLGEFTFSQSKETIILVKDCQFLSFDLKSQILEKKSLNFVNSYSILSIYPSLDTAMMIVRVYENRLYLFSVDTWEITKEYEISKHINLCSISPDLKFFVYTFEEGGVYMQNLESFETNKIDFPDSAKATGFFFSNDSKKLIVKSFISKSSGGNYKYLLYNFDSKFYLEKELDNAFEKNLKVIFTKNSPHLITMDSDYSLSLKDIISNQNIYRYSRENFKLLDFIMTEDENFLITAWEDGCIILINADSFLEIQKITLEPFNKEYDTSLFRIFYSTNLDRLIILEDESFQIISNFLRDEFFLNKICKKFDNLQDFQSIENKFQLSNYPNKMNILHRGLLSEDPLKALSFIENSLGKQSKLLIFSLLNDRDDNQKDCWYYLLNYVDKENFSSVFLKFIEYSSLEPEVLENHVQKIKLKSNFFQQICEISPSKMDSVLSRFLVEKKKIKVKSNNQFHFVILSLDTCYSSGDHLKESFYEKYSERQVLHGKVQLIDELRVLICLITPSEFLTFFEIFTSFPSTSSIFINRTLVLLVDFLWENLARKDFIRNLCFYLFFLILLCINLLWIFPQRISESLTELSHPIVLTSLILNIFTLVYLLGSFIRMELLSVIMMRDKNLKERLKIYIGSVWNKLDLLLLLIGFVSTSLDITQILKSNFDLVTTVKVLYSLFLYISWARLIEFARGFNITSALIRLLSRVLEDMFGFLIILFLAVIGSALPTFLLQSTYNNNNPWNFIKIFYNILLGDFGDFKSLDESSSLNIDLYFLIFLGITVFLVIVMLNLLIAIISDSFEKVMALEQQAKTFEKLQLISETLRTVSRSDIDQFSKIWESKYLYVLEKDSQDSIEDVNERLRNKIDRLETILNDIPSSINALMKETYKKNMETVLDNINNSNKKYMETISKQYEELNASIKSLQINSADKK